MATKKKTTKAKKTSRTDKIKGYLKRAKTARTLAEIIDAIGATDDERKFVASTCLRLVESGKLRRKENRDAVWSYTARV